MAVVISPNVVLDQSALLRGGGTITADNPIIGYHTLVATGNVTSTTAAAGKPVSNLANTSTFLRWEGLVTSPAADEYITVTLAAVDPINYLAIARHNLATIGATVSVEGTINLAASPVVWSELVAGVILPNDGPALFRFADIALDAIRLRIQPGTAAPTIAVMYTGKLLTLQRRIYVGHTPISYGRVSKITNNRSENGNFLGRVLLNQFTRTSIILENMTPAYYRELLEPFIVSSYTEPFFFAWRPGAYPNEIGYVWSTNDAQPENQLPNGMMAIDMEISGIYR